MKQIVAVVFGLGLLCNALLFVPQAVAVWRKKTDEGVSLITFGGFSVLQAIGIVHGVYQGDPSLTLGMAASLLTCGTVTALTVVYVCGVCGAAAWPDRPSLGLCLPLTDRDSHHSNPIRFRPTIRSPSMVCPAQFRKGSPLKQPQKYNQKNNSGKSRFRRERISLISIYYQ